jgi:hypothetical protein
VLGLLLHDRQAFEKLNGIIISVDLYAQFAKEIIYNFLIK